METSLLYTILEYVGFATGLLCVWLAAKENVLNWFFAIISILCYLVIFIHFKLYGDAGLQVYFLVVSIYGWRYWYLKKDDKAKPIVSLPWKSFVWYLLAGLVLWVLIYFILNYFTDTDVAVVDAFCTAFSLTAQVLLARKAIQNWHLWFVVNVIYIPLYIYKDLYPTALLYFIFLILSVYGIRAWKTKMSKFA